jgi:hypothetical protein
MTTAWSHLPNAEHIDRILKDVKVNRGRWLAASTKAETVIEEEVRIAAMDEYCRVAWDNDISQSIWSALLDSPGRQFRFSSWAEAWDAAWDAMVSLVVWDDAGDYLNLSVDQVQELAMLGDKKAILMLPAVLAFEKSKELA